MLGRRAKRRQLMSGLDHTISEVGLTFWRKRHPLDCGRPQCGMCSGEKLVARHKRSNERRAAIGFEMRNG